MLFNKGLLYRLPEILYFSVQASAKKKRITTPPETIQTPKENTCRE
jgi:hypothetical protein